MSSKILSILIVVAVLSIAGVLFVSGSASNGPESGVSPPKVTEEKKEAHPLMIEEMRKTNYLGSEITVEEILPPGSNYQRYVVSYRSEGLRIRGLLTVPNERLDSGWPAIIFNHGYIPPKEYRTLERYVAYIDGFARNGYIVFKIDYRGHDKSEGESSTGHFSPDYTVDVLNAVASIKKFPGVNPNKIGMWGHSMGGSLTLRSMVVSSDIKSGVIWAGVVGDYTDLLERFRKRIPWLTRQIRPPTLTVMSEFLTKYGSPSANPAFWQSIDPHYHLDNISGPIQLHHGTADESVPWEFSESLASKLKKAGKNVELYKYEGADHNISGTAFELAMQRSIEFFDRYLKIKND